MRILNLRYIYTAILFSRKAEISLYPNPASDFIRIRIPVQDLESASVTIFDMSGRSMGSFNASAYSFDEQTLQLPLPDRLPAGFYTIKIRSGKNIYTNSFVLSR